MKINAKVQYALIVMTELAFHYGSGRSISVSEIGERERIPKKFLEHIVSDLKAKNLIHAQRGAKGGYGLTKSPDKIDLKVIFEAVQGRILSYAPQGGTGGTPAGSVADDFFCRLDAHVSDFLGSQTLADFLRSYREGQSAPMFYI